MYVVYIHKKLMKPACILTRNIFMYRQWLELIQINEYFIRLNLDFLDYTHYYQ